MKVGEILEIRDPIYGLMSFSDSEAKFIHSKSFDRLRRIKQLSFSEYVYPSATHNRYTHSLGVCHIITEMYKQISKSNPTFFKDGDLELLRMMALSHDIGHSPFSHSSEVLSNITHEERLEDILKLEKSNVILPNNYDVEGYDLINQVYNGDGLVYVTDKRLITLHDFMDGFIDADKIDYLVRDAKNCGIMYGNFDRLSLISHLTLFEDKDGIYRLAVEEDGLQALESFILARYYMFSQVYFHPTRRLYDKLFIDNMQKILPNGCYPDDIKKFLKWDDSKVVPKLNFLSNTHYELVYDSNFDPKVKKLIDRKLGKYLICDTPRKSLFRKDTDDLMIYIKTNVDGKFVPCTQVSAILRGIQYECIHKLRYYAPNEISTEIKQEIAKSLKGGVLY